MLKALLRPDGSVSAVEAHPKVEAGAGPGNEMVLFPLDGLPRSIDLDSSDWTADSGPGRWTGGFAFPVWDRHSATLCPYSEHHGAPPLYYHHPPHFPLLAGGLPAAPPPFPA